MQLGDKVCTKVEVNFREINTPKFRAIRDKLVEEGVRRIYERCLGRKVLISFGNVWANDQEERSFDPPIEAVISPTSDANILRWMDAEHLDPYWNVTITNHYGQLDENDRMYAIYGLGWSAEKGFDKKSCAEWTVSN